MNTVRSGELRRSSRDHKSRAILIVGLRISLCQIPSASMVPASAHGTQQSTLRDDRKVSWAAITPPRPCHSMAWSDGISIIYIVNLFANKQVPTKQVNRLCARCCTQHLTHTGNYCQLFPCSLRLHISMCSRRSSNGLILSAYARFHPSCCCTKIAPPVPS